MAADVLSNFYETKTRPKTSCHLTLTGHCIGHSCLMIEKLYWVIKLQLSGLICKIIDNTYLFTVVAAE